MSKKNSRQNGKQGNKGNKPPFRGYGGGKQDKRAEEIADDAAAMSRSNPISTYNKYKQFSADASKLPFSYPLGYHFDNLFKIPGSLPVDDDNDFVVPGIMSIRFSASIGRSDDFTSPINRSSIQFWTYLRSIMKAAGSYDHQDITMMTLALDQCIMFHSLLRRIYGLLPDTTPLNRYYAKAMIEACGVDYDDLIQNIQDFRAYINEFAYRLQQYALPNDIEMFNRHTWMCEGIYTDSGSTRAQTYMFVPLGFWIYDNTVETGSQLTFSYWSYDPSTGITGKWTYEQIMDYGNTLINAISGDEDFAMISGDMYTLYKGKTYALPYVTENYQILPKYDKVVLSQIENATICGLFESSYTPVISQNPDVNSGAILYQPEFNNRLASYYGDVAMNFHEDSPSPDAVLEASRLTANIALKTGTTRTCELISSGTEIVHGVTVFKLNLSNGGAEVALRLISRKYQFSSTVDQTNLTNTIGLISSALTLAQFDWAPRIELFQNYGTDDAPDVHIIGTTWDLDNVGDVEPNQLAIMHDACLWSEFDVPPVSGR